ncbi:hypothetical protein Agub_g12444 [Astrephomene gubernaculifera]|uniref:Fe2OG dioxygenase domain-containing protein n=1 Tax=Astrephomene gubernaculifera TaxID=47775 RepID=A0AAD3E0Z2_9CHLO|nr:hypothetical protein Agub_g12444 [Astrephomene gubernaculifera]
MYHAIRTSAGAHASSASPGPASPSSAHVTQLAAKRIATCARSPVAHWARPLVECLRLAPPPREAYQHRLGAFRRGVAAAAGVPLTAFAASISTSSSASAEDQRQQQEQQQPQQDEKKAPKRGQRQRSATAADISKTGAVLFIGFHPEELEAVRQNLPGMLPSSSSSPTPSSSAAAELPIVDVTYDMLPHTVRDVLLPSPADAAIGVDDSRSSSDSAPDTTTLQQQQQASLQDQQQPQQQPTLTSAVAAGRVVLLVGPTAHGLGAELNDWLAEWGVVPALIAAYQRKHEGMPLRSLVASLRDAHSRYYGLLQPVKVEPLALRQLLDDSSSSSGSSSSSKGCDGRCNCSCNGSSSSSSTGGSGSSNASASTSAGVTSAAEGDAVSPSDQTEASAAAALEQQQQHLSVLREVRVVLNAALDAGEVPSIHGHYRPDSGHLVVLDGLLSGAERSQLLAWLTAPAHCHQGPPPENKWEVACVDREGDKATWGLQPAMLAALRDDPPPPVVALQTRLAALYPEYDICHMPAAQISSDAPEPGAEGGAEGDEGTPLSSFVGNAVMAGDPCAWHVDADPTTVPPHSPWVHNFGYYHNRELGRPLFVSVLLYLNDSWSEDFHSETLFLDPETQLGLFVRPAPGRVVLFDQDVPHRISPPSSLAPGPRYSLVWKLVMVPRGEAAAGVGEQAGDGKQQGRGAEGAGKGACGGGCGAEGEGVGYQSICRPEWGEPVRIGSANRRTGVPAFQRKVGGR